jgi:HK97 family phage prohead protease
MPKRIVTVIAMPYERPTEIVEGGRTFTEVVSRGAFTGSEKRTSKIRANRDHSWSLPVGRVVGLHPSRREGLVAEVKISGTQLGNDTLELCEDDVLSASAGFKLLQQPDGRVWDDAEVWENGGVSRRLNRLWLDHLAFVPNPAYPDAEVISVRSIAVTPQEPLSGEQVSVSAPNLDRLRTDALNASYAELDRRWGR